MFNKVQLVTFPHVVLSAYLTGAAFVVGVGFWSMLRKDATDEDRGLHRLAVRSGAVVVLVAGLGVAVTGDAQGKVMTEVQPMKMAAAEGLYDTTDHAAVLGADDRRPRRLQREEHHRAARAAVVPRHRDVRRRGAGHQPAPRGVPADVRPGPRRHVLLPG